VYETQTHSMCPASDVDRFVFDLSWPDPGRETEVGTLRRYIELDTSVRGIIKD
jgi:hypothetical protein